MKKRKNIGGGLTDLPEDKRDFSRTAVFGTMRGQDLPTGDFTVAPPQDIKDQADEDFCALYSTAEVSEDQEMVPLEQYFNAYVAKVLIQKSPETWGCDLRTAGMSHVKYGALELELSPFVNWEDRPTRDEVLDPKNWIEDHFMLAAEHRKNSMFDVLKDSPHDKFDSTRVALWMHRASFKSIFTGCKWRASWTDAPGGVIPKEIDPDERYTPHAFKIFGQRYFDGEPYLVAQLSNGEEIGEKGIFFFPRSVVEREFTYGIYMFEDMPKKVAQTHLYYGTSVNDSLFTKAFKIISKILSDLFKKFV